MTDNEKLAREYANAGCVALWDASWLTSDAEADQMEELVAHAILPLFPAPQSQDGLRERLANYAHEAWAGWMGYLGGKAMENADGTVTISKREVDRWTRQVGTKYADLSESEQASDLAEADKILALLPAPQPVGDAALRSAAEAVHPLAYVDSETGEQVSVSELIEALRPHMRPDRSGELVALEAENAQLRRAVGLADVMLENYMPQGLCGVMSVDAERLGLSPELLAKCLEAAK